MKNANLKDLVAMNSNELPTLQKFKPDRGRLGLAALQGFGNSTTETTDLGSGFKAFSPDLSNVMNFTQAELGSQRNEFAQGEEQRMNRNISLMSQIIEGQNKAKLQKEKQQAAKSKEDENAFQSSLDRKNKLEIEKLKQQAAKSKEDENAFQSSLDRKNKLEIEKLKQKNKKDIEALKTSDKKRQKRLDAESLLLAWDIPFNLDDEDGFVIQRANIQDKLIKKKRVELGIEKDEIILKGKKSDPDAEVRIIKFFDSFDPVDLSEMSAQTKRSATKLLKENKFSPEEIKRLIQTGNLTNQEDKPDLSTAEGFGNFLFTPTK